MRTGTLPLALLLMAQTSPRLPPANPIPYEAPDPLAVLKPIEAIFAAFEAGDGAAVLAQAYPEGRVTATGTRRGGASGVRAESFAEFAKRLTPATAFRERITDPAIEIDGDIAMVWARYSVRIGDRVSNCGFDHFDLVREGGVWKVMNITFSSQVTGCE